MLGHFANFKRLIQTDVDHGSKSKSKKNQSQVIHRGQRLTLESLEPRHLLAANPIITEFLSRSTGTLNDNGTTLSDPPDWIEVYNAGDESINLEGWHLTDKAGNLDKWAFPEYHLGAGEYAIVLATDAPPPEISIPTRTWDGGGDGTDWHDPLNWNTDGAPDPSDALVIASGTPTSTINVNIVDGSITQTGGDITLSGRFNSFGTDPGNGTYNLEGGTLLVNYSGGLSHSFNVGNGTKTGSLIQSGGVVTVIPNVGPINIGNQAAATGTWEISGGAIDAQGGINVGTTGTGTFNYIGTNATVDVGANYTANTSSSTTVFELDGIARTIIPADGNITLDNSTIEIKSALGASLVFGTLYTLFQADADTNFVGSLSANNINLLFDDPADWQLTTTTGLGGSITARYIGDGTPSVAPGGDTLYANFQLSGDGDYLALVMPDGQTVVSEFGQNGADFPFQFEDVSYGVLQDVVTDAPLSQIGYFLNPTPGGPNGVTAESLGPAIQDVTHTPNIAVANEDLVVTAVISSSGEPVSSVVLHTRTMYDAEVVLPMVDDGTGDDLQAGDGIYTAAIPEVLFNAGEMIRYYITTADSGGFDSRAPLFLDSSGENQSVEYFGTVVADSTNDSTLPVLEWFVEPSDIANGLDDLNKAGARTSLFYDGQFYDNIYARTRGFSVRLFNPTGKLSYKLEFNSGDYFQFTTDEQPVEEINLNSNVFDKSMVRITLASDIFEKAGIPAPINFPIRVERNGEFFQLSNITEEPDATFLQREGLDPNGALYKMYNKIDSVTTPSGSSPDALRKKTRRDEGLNDLQDLVDGLALTGVARTNFIYDNVDLPSVINYVATRIGIIADGDSHQKNYYLFRDSEGSGLWTLIPWDPDLTFGHGTTGVYSQTVVGTRPLNLSASNRLIGAIYDTPEFAEMYFRRIQTLLDEVLQPPGTPQEELWLEQRIDELVIDMTPDVILDLAKWGTFNGGGSPISATESDFINAIDQLKQDYFAVRRNFLANHPSIPASGITTESTTLLAAGAPAQVLVPSVANGGDLLGDSWKGAVAFNDTTWLSADTGIGYDANDDYDSLFGYPSNGVIETQLLDEMRNIGGGDTQFNESVFIRIPFNVDLVSLSDFDSLELEMRYDDGFVAYINGIPVANSNDPVPVAWNSGATTQTLDESQVLIPQAFNITSRISDGTIVDGTNILAIQGLNFQTSSSDLLILPEIVGVSILDNPINTPTLTFGIVDFNPSSGNQNEEYIEIVNSNAESVDISLWQLTGGVQFTFTPGTVIPANTSLYVSPDTNDFRSRASSPTSGEGLFVVGDYSGHVSNSGELIELLDDTGAMNTSITTPVQLSDNQKYLRVTELHYNPSSPADDTTEFIELQNISDSVTLDLTGVQIVDGPSTPFDFTGSIVTSLLPGQFVLVVKNQAAFELEYPSVNPLIIAGEYEGSLSNGGEKIKIEDADNSTIVEFKYEDGRALDEADWHPETDNEGFSLVVKDPTSSNDLDLGISWRSSSSLKGSPGAVDNESLDADFNGDEIVNNLDLQILLQNYGTAIDAHRGIGDADGDRKVSLSDLLILKKTFGDIVSSPPPAAAAAALTVSIGSTSQTNSTTQSAAIDHVITKAFDEGTFDNQAKEQEDALPIRKAQSQRYVESVDQAHANTLSPTGHRTSTISLTRARRGHRTESRFQLLTDLI